VAPTRTWRRPRIAISPAALRAEGVVELGRAPATSVLYVLTSDRLCLFHVASVPDRALDGYAVELAVSWIGNGIASSEVADNLGVSEPTLQNALLAAGYERVSASRTDRVRHRANRRGRLVRKLPDAAQVIDEASRK
jgi:DNA-binding CsgD family transcriptional regulator